MRLLTDDNDNVTHNLTYTRGTRVKMTLSLSSRKISVYGTVETARKKSNRVGVRWDSGTLTYPLIDDLDIAE